MNDNPLHIDAMVRERLQSLPAPEPPLGGWDAMEQQLDGDADLVLRDALVGLASDTPSGWEALERRIDPQSDTDKAIADRLNGLEDVPATGWSVLAARLDQENDEAVDAIVSDGLARSATSPASGWAALAARLELIGWRRSTLAAWRITEFCLLLSLLLLFVRFGPSTTDNSTFAELTEGFPLPRTGAAETVPESASPPIVGGAPETEMRVLKDHPVTANDLTIVVSKRNNTIASVPVRMATGTPTAPVSAGTEATDASTENIQGITKTAVPLPVLTTKLYAPETISGLKIAALKTRRYPPSPALTLPGRDVSEPTYYYLNVFVSPVDLNQVITPATEAEFIDIEADRRFTYGKSAGMMLDIEQGKNTLQFGAVYARRSYIPTALKWYLRDEFPLVEPIQGYSRFSFESINFDLNYKRSLIKNDKWRFSSRVGMGLNVVAYSDFVGRKEVIDGLNESLEFLELHQENTSAPSSGRSTDREASVADSKRIVDPINGWWEGGSALDNSTLYVNGGFVMERLMNDRWSVYVSPSFSRVVYLKKDQGIGPFKDRINPFGVRFGSRFHFGGK